jgi:interferon gamma-inducible protein 30
MAGPRRLLLLPPLVLLLVAAGALLLPQRGSAEEGKVSLELYYESLCPYCSRFIVNHLAGILEDGLIDAVHLRLVPYGNARVGSNSEISCQVHYHDSDSPIISKLLMNRSIIMNR